MSMKGGSAVPPAPTFARHGLVPITVGVTGHRDIPPEDAPKLSASLRAELDRIGAEHPHSPKILLSGLAEGADRLAARCALDAGWQLGAVLPLPQDDYETDFASPESIAEFRDLLARAAWVQVAGSENDHVRPACYAALGRWLSRYAFTLVALWDGNLDSRDPGGTADTVLNFLEGISDNDVTLPESGPVIQIVTRRLRAMDAPLTVGEVIRHAPRPAGLPGEGEAARWSLVFRRIDEFNHDATEAMQTMPSAIGDARSWLFVAKDFDEAASSLPARAASWVHAVADRISFATQGQRDGLLRNILLLALLAIAVEQLYGGPFPTAWLLLVAIGCGVAAVVVYRHGRRRRMEERYLDYRALAEACRTQFYWKLAGIPDCAADYFLREQRDELEWIRQAVLATELGADRSWPATAGQISRIRDWWIDGQRAWLLDEKNDRKTGKIKSRGKVADNDLLSRRWGKLASGFALGGLATVIALLPFHVFLAPALGDKGDFAVAAVTAVYGALFAAGGLAKVYAEIKAFNVQALRYRRNGLAFTLARNRLDAALAAGDLPAAQTILREAGKAALAENADWLLIHRERPVSVPIG